MTFQTYRLHRSAMTMDARRRPSVSPPKHATGPVTVMKVDRTALAMALALANNDASRLTFPDERTVIVHNHKVQR